jgi:uncharacterized protein YprB with RNaseH-like and TPR domain
MTTALKDRLSLLHRARSATPGGFDPARLEQILRPLMGAPPDLATAVGGSVVTRPEGEFLVISRSCPPGAAEIRRRYRALFPRRRQQGPRRERRISSEGAVHPAVAALAEADLHRVAFLDIETTGFLGRPIFLTGLLRWRDRTLRIEQFLARDYAEERAMLAQVAERWEDIDVLITFNGKSFDVPYLRDRMEYHRLAGGASFRHFDLLHHARRQWRDQLPNCRLQTLEGHLCGRKRIGDVPGFLIPEQYHRFVRTRDPRLVSPILHHNRLDLLAMAELTALLAESV